MKELNKIKMKDLNRLKELAGIREDYAKLTPEHIEEYWTTMVESQPKSVIETLTTLTTGELTYDNFIKYTQEDVFDSYRDRLYSDKD
jgi:hypothetical protein